MVADMAGLSPPMLYVATDTMYVTPPSTFVIDAKLMLGEMVMGRAMPDGAGSV